jgi:demethylmenaquinone methyltransferase/2-methoxy-6-polyprenyl-1,4-benzoquinol methylase
MPETPAGAVPGGGVADEQVAPGAPTTNKVKAIFSNIAGTYDLINLLASFGRDRAWRRVTVRAARLGVDSRALDMAAGTGDLTMALARYGRPAEVVGTDFVPEMLEVAKPKVAKYRGRTRIELQVADAQDLPFADASFNAVTIGFGVRNLPDRAANFREVMRVLAPGGRYVILEFTTPPNPVVRAFYHWYLRTFVPFLGQVVAGDRSSYQYLNDSILLFPKQAELAAELREAGFDSVTWRDLTFGIVAVHTATKARD